MRRIALLALVAPLSLGAAVYHADPRLGDDARDGLTPACAFRTLARATRALTAGDTLELAPGSRFEEALVVRVSGTAEKPIVIRGNGAILSGAHPLDPAKWEAKGNDLWFQPNGRCWGALRPRVYIGDEMISPVCGHPNDVEPTALGPRAAIWRTEGVYFRAEAGRTPRDYALLGGAGRSKDEHSGVIIENQSYITVEDLIAERFPNDGFNVHGTCRGLVFRNIVARQNGDDGFSIHEDVLATVIGLHSHHNDFGIQDVGVSQTIVSGAVLEENRLAGYDVYGGIRILRDATVRANGGRQMRIGPTLDANRVIASPMGATTAYLEGVRVEGGEGEALCVAEGVTVTAKDCVFRGTPKGVVGPSACLRLENCKTTD